MSKNTKIEWRDHASKARNPSIRMRHPVAVLAKRFSVAHIEAPLRAIGERLDVVRFEVAAAIVTTVHTREFVSAHDVESPLPPFWRSAEVFSLLRFTVDVTVAFRTARRFLAGPLANQCSRLGAVLRAKTIARPSLRSRAHLGATLGRHL
nr:hypothetical protein [Burkholderia pseudomallei]